MAGGGTGGSEPGPRTQPSWFRGKLLYWLVWPLMVALDLWSKSAVFAFLLREQRLLAEHERVHHLISDGPLRLQLVMYRNAGTIWGLFQDYTYPLMVLRVAALFVLAWFLRQTPPRARVQQLVLSLITAGALGNLYDNFFAYERKVRDFLYFTGSWPVRWSFPAFNVADSCITVGAIALVFMLWREDPEAKRRARQVSS